MRHPMTRTKLFKRISTSIAFGLVLVIFLSSLSYAEIERNAPSDNSKVDSATTQGLTYYGILEEFMVPTQSSFPDQISVDKKDRNIVWFTEPWQNQISSFNYKTKTFNIYPCGKSGVTPDGMTIDSNNNIWYGGYDSGDLGFFDTNLKQHKFYPADYQNGRLAIPFEDSYKKIWITDHESNILSYFDPKTQSWEYYRMFEPETWIVGVDEDSETNIWYTGHFINKIGVIWRDGKKHKGAVSIKKSIWEKGKFKDVDSGYQWQQFPLPTTYANPGFLYIDDNDQIWSPEWGSHKLAKLDRQSLKFVEYALDDYNAGPGNIVIQGSKIYFAERSANNITLFFENVAQFFRFPIKSPDVGQKDGIAIDDTGVVWFTGSYSNMIGRFEIFRETQFVKMKEQIIENKGTYFMVTPTNVMTDENKFIRSGKSKKKD